MEESQHLASYHLPVPSSLLLSGVSHLALWAPNASHSSKQRKVSLSRNVLHLHVQTQQSAQQKPESLELLTRPPLCRRTQMTVKKINYINTIFSYIWNFHSEQWVEGAPRLSPFQTLVLAPAVEDSHHPQSAGIFCNTPRMGNLASQLESPLPEIVSPSEHLALKVSV
jgi:hypothetical protein